MTTRILKSLLFDSGHAMTAEMTRAALITLLGYGRTSYSRNFSITQIAWDTVYFYKDTVDRFSIYYLADIDPGTIATFIAWHSDYRTAPRKPHK